jgi:AcrR family transcriptional regulator
MIVHSFLSQEEALVAPRTELQNRTLREESVRRIVEAASSLFARFGFERTSVRMITREAGVSQGLLYNYFSSKEDLLRVIFERALSDIRASLGTLSEESPDPALQLEEYIRHTFAILQRRHEFWRLFYSLRMQPAVLTALRGDIATWVEEINQSLTAQFQRLGAPNPLTKAASLFALIDGVAQQYTLDPEHYPLAGVIAEIVDIYCVSRRESR